ncbi:MAG: D-glycero-alpha-D-manno-heptose-1,7-bisphosphate 7-phosphatase [Pyrinomonadaceae bacterium]
MSEKRPAIFVDRDGTLVEEVNYLSRVEDLQIFPYTREALELFRSKNFLIIVVTNQSGIGRGIYDERAMESIHEQMRTELDCLIDRFYFCPHLPESHCACRKPGIGMIENAMADFAIERKKSWMIGDKKIDVETGENAKTKTALVLTGYGEAHRKLLHRPPDIVAADLLAAARRIIGFA